VLATAHGAPAAPGAAAPPPTVLVVDDVRNIRRMLDLVLRGDGYDVVEAETAEEALDVLGRRPIDVVIADLMLPGMSGIDLLRRVKSDETTRELPVIVISGHASVKDAALAVRLGAADFFEKPLARERVLVSLRNALAGSRLARRVAAYAAAASARDEMIGESPVMQRLYDEIERVAPTKASVLITGESGTGKELVSRAIHRLSPRSGGPFVKVNCAAIPRELIESELFGHEKGAFTGALARKRGLFEQGHGGTMFLDEVADMDLAAQAKLLRALQSGEVARLGGETVLHVDVRVLAATNKDLEREVAAGRFREDLYFRLAVFPVRTPPLRERRSDVRALADSFMAQFCRENGLRPKMVLPEVYAALARRQFPGNVRELKNVVERAIILSGDVITIADLPEDPHHSPFDDADGDGPTPLVGVDGGPPCSADEPGRRLTLREFRERAERRYIVEVLASLEWNISRAAQALGVERTNLHKKIRAYGIRRGES
jgi:DNA-binding NtrC family response regulator